MTCATAGASALMPLPVPQPKSATTASGGSIAAKAAARKLWPKCSARTASQRSAMPAKKALGSPRRVSIRRSRRSWSCWRVAQPAVWSRARTHRSRAGSSSSSSTMAYRWAVPRRLETTHPWSESVLRCLLTVLCGMPSTSQISATPSSWRSRRRSSRSRVGSDRASIQARRRSGWMPFRSMSASISVYPAKAIDNFAPRPHAALAVMTGSLSGRWRRIVSISATGSIGFVA